jgi:hypothetical protein
MKDEMTSYNFDLNQHYTFNYTHTLQPIILRKEIKFLADVIRETLNDKAKRYSLVKHMSISVSAIKAIEEGDINTKLLKEIQQNMRDVQIHTKFTSSQNYQFPWSSLLKKTNYVFNEVQRIINNHKNQDKIINALDNELEEMGFKHNQEVQMSILDNERNFVYHDWENMRGTHANHRGTDGYDIYDEIEKYSHGVVAWVDRISNIERDISAVYKRLNIALLKNVREEKKIRLLQKTQPLDIKFYGGSKSGLLMFHKS